MIRELKELGYNYEKDMSGLGMKMNYKTNKMVYVKGGFNGFRRIEEEDVGVVAFAEAMSKKNWQLFYDHIILDCHAC